MLKVARVVGGIARHIGKAMAENRYFWLIGGT